MKVDAHNLNELPSMMPLYLYHSKLASKISGEFTFDDKYKFTCCCTRRPEYAISNSSSKNRLLNCCAFPDKTLVTTTFVDRFREDTIKTNNRDKKRLHAPTHFLDAPFPCPGSVDKRGLDYNHLTGGFRRSAQFHPLKESPKTKRSLVQKTLDLLNHLRK